MLDSIKSQLMLQTRLTDLSVNEDLDYSKSAISSTVNSNTNSNYELSVLQSLLTLHMSKHVYNDSKKVFDKLTNNPEVMIEVWNTQFARVKPHVNKYN